MMRVLVVLLAAALSGCAVFRISGPSDTLARTAYVVDLPLDRAIAELAPGYVASVEASGVLGERIYTASDGSSRITVRLRPRADTSTVVLVSSRAPTVEGSVSIPSPFRRDPFGRELETQSIPLAMTGDCPPTWSASDPAVVDDPPEEMIEPQLMGGLAGLAARVRYPGRARRANQHGLVYVQFIVERDGSVGCAQIARGSWDALDAEALRVVRESRFTPGIIDGEPVRVRFTLPIRFTLR